MIARLFAFRRRLVLTWAERPLSPVEAVQFAALALFEVVALTACPSLLIALHRRRKRHA